MTAHRLAAPASGIDTCGLSGDRTQQSVTAALAGGDPRRPEPAAVRPCVSAGTILSDEGTGGTALELLADGDPIRLSQASSHEGARPVDRHTAK